MDFVPLRACGTLHTGSINFTEIRSFFRALFTYFVLIIPKRLIWWTSTVCSIRSYRSWACYILAFAFFLIVNFLFCTVGQALIDCSIVGSWRGAAYTSLRIQAKVGTGGAVETGSWDWAYIGGWLWTGSQIVFYTIGKHLKTIGFLCHVAINPITGDKIIFVSTLWKIDKTTDGLWGQLYGYFGAIGVDDLLDGGEIVLLSFDIELYLSIGAAVLAFDEVLF